MNFSEALHQLKAGERITRKHRENVCLYRHYFSEDKSKLFYDFIDKSVVDEIRPFNEVILTSEDLLAYDWEIVNCKTPDQSSNQTTAGNLAEPPDAS
jgi:hypothetical protein